MSSRLRKAVLWIASLTAVVILAVGSYGFSPVVDRSLGTEPQANAAEVLPASPKLVDFARDEARAIDAFVVRRSGLTVAQWGEASVPMNLSSVRKAVLSLLYGVAEAKGLVDLDRTLGTIGIDESATPLTDTEKRATIRDLLKARSGVYLPTGAETATMLRTRPARGSVGPGERFFYNNWDFNVLGVAFERETGMTIGKALQEWLAGPIGMRDFHPTHVVWDRWFSPSDHPTYRIHMSARDLALVGQLLLDNGIANGERIVPAAYLRDSLTPWSEVGPELTHSSFEGFGYAWWLNTSGGNDGLVLSSGWGGQYLIVDRANDLVVVARNDTGNSPLVQLWFGEFGTRGRIEDAMRLREISLDAVQ